jgi:hypothetical protein
MHVMNPMMPQKGIFIEHENVLPVRIKIPNKYLNKYLLKYAIRDLSLLLQNFGFYYNHYKLSNTKKPTK